MTVPELSQKMGLSQNSLRRGFIRFIRDFNGADSRVAAPLPDNLLEKQVCCRVLIRTLKWWLDLKSGARDLLPSMAWQRRRRLLRVGYTSSVRSVFGRRWTGVNLIAQTAS